MNVEDTEAPEVPEGACRLEMMFERQRELADKYHPIELSNGIGYAVLQGRPFDIHHRFSQQLVKDMAQRATEEVCEATTAVAIDDWGSTHAKEEVADAIHFMIELLILVGIDASRVVSDTGTQRTTGDGLASVMYGMIIGYDHRERAFDCVEKISEAMMLLKQKPWKTTHVQTDAPLFNVKIVQAFHSLLFFAMSMGLDDKQVFDLYFRKSEVNKFRQRSAY